MYSSLDFHFHFHKFTKFNRFHNLDHPTVPNTQTNHRERHQFSLRISITQNSMLARSIDIIGAAIVIIINITSITTTKMSSIAASLSCQRRRVQSQLHRYIKSLLAKQIIAIIAVITITIIITSLSIASLIRART